MTLLKPHEHDIGALTVRRLLPGFPQRTVGPFIFFDHMGPARFAPGQGLDVRPHPHIGLATVTFLFEGVIEHRDSLGSIQPIVPGDVNWMTAGSGIAHSERTPREARREGSRLHGIQTWLALPRAAEESPPAFVHHPAASIPRLGEPGVRIQLVAGSAYGRTSPVATFSPTLYLAIELDAGVRLRLPADCEELGVYLAEGEVLLDGQALPPHHLALASAAGEIVAGKASRLIAVGGARLDGDRYIWWNFVSSSRERIEQAKSDWREHRYAQVVGEHERIELPESAGPAGRARPPGDESQAL